MLVYKFGGASIATPQRMKALLPIMAEARQPFVLVISALGKTTNALEEIVMAAHAENRTDAHNRAVALEQQHRTYARTLLDDVHYRPAETAMSLYFTELQWAIDDARTTQYDYAYDQIVCIGEMLSSTIFAFFLQQHGYGLDWIDVRDVLRTDATYRDARVDWDSSAAQAQQVIGSRLDAGKNVITQGFVGATAENTSTTLGREGSDYTAALLAAMLGADSVTIWKDVAGFLSADPKAFPQAEKIDRITYHEVIELAYYGAQIIHPKTIKPLQNHHIPLYVKCFLDKDLTGTVVLSDARDISYPPLIVSKKNQTLLQITTRDFSFITEENLSRLYTVFAGLHIKISLLQNAAISLIACIDNQEEKVAALIAQLEPEYKVLRNDGVSLLTIRHYAPETIIHLTRNHTILLEQRTRHTVQVVVA
jgi:aspartate kinase